MRWIIRKQFCWTIRVLEEGGCECIGRKETLHSHFGKNRASLLGTYLLMGKGAMSSQKLTASCCAYIGQDLHSPGHLHLLYLTWWLFQVLSQKKKQFSSFLLLFLCFMFWILHHNDDLLEVIPAIVLVLNYLTNEYHQIWIKGSAPVLPGSGKQSDSPLGTRKNVWLWEPLNYLGNFESNFCT